MICGWESVGVPGTNPLWQQEMTEVFGESKVTHIVFQLYGQSALLNPVFKGQLYYGPTPNGFQIF